jgi:outer membrane protein assembly factor BamB
MRRAVSATAVLLLTAVALTGTAHPATTARPGAAAPSDLGIAWRADLPANGDFLATDDVVVAAGPHAVVGIDGRTGQQRWQYAPPAGFTIQNWRLTAGVVVLASDTVSNPVERPTDLRWQTTGLDAATGRRLWTDADRPELQPTGLYVLQPAAPQDVAASGDTVLTPRFDDATDAPVGIVALAARTGEVSWDQSLDGWTAPGFSGCALAVGGDFIGTEAPLLAAGDRVVVFVARCQQGTALVGLDPHTGATRWVVPLSGDPVDRLLTDGDAILVGQGRRGTIVDPDGQVRFQGDIPPGERRLAVVGDVAVIAGTDGTSDPITGVDLRTGRTLWTHPRPSAESPQDLRAGTYRELATVDGAVLGYRFNAGGRTSGPEIAVPGDHLLAAAVDRIDPATGATTPTALPVTGDGRIAATRLLLVSSGVRLLALRLAPDGTPPTDHAPAPPDRWPDACAALTSDQLRALWPNSTPTVQKQYASVLDRPLPAPVHCDYGDPAGGMVVAIRWVAANPRSAGLLVADARHAFHAATALGSSLWDAPPPPPPLPGPWSAAWSPDQPATWVVVQIGPVVAEIRSWDPTVPAVGVARLITTTLHDRGYR